VAILIPLSTRTGFTPEERISLRHLVHFLGRYEKYLIAPRGMRIELEGFRVKHFSRKYFGSAVAHNHLLFNPLFYRSFGDYEYVFLYHLDSLAFADQLEYWCGQNFDYIGPPWMHCPDSPWVTRPRVGNGGFSLLRVRSVLTVLYNRYRMEPSTYWIDMFTRNGRHLRPLIHLLEKLQPLFPKSKLVNVPLAEWRKAEDPGPNSRNNDIFWSDRAITFLPEFKVASFEDGLRFGFEVAPRTCFEMNGRKMPFGCHAWARYDRSFWEPHLLAKEDEQVVCEQSEG
jgi:hypothetical protein